MLINIFEELNYEDFIRLNSIKDLPEEEQQKFYNQYLQDLSTARHNWNNYQSKGPLVRLQSSSNPISCTAGMDVVFVIDYTASMGAEIDLIKADVLNIVNTIIAQSGNDYRLGLVLFDEYQVGNPINYGLNPLYTDLPASQRIVTDITYPVGIYQVLTAYEMMSSNNQLSFSSSLNELNGALELGAGGGFVTTGEPGDLALEQVIDFDFAGAFRPDKAKLIILFTDDEPGGYDGDKDNPDVVTRLESLRDTCISEGIQLITLSQIVISPNTSYRIISDNANGAYDNSLDPNTAITAIENICEDNA